ncbi:uncharacterized protein KY384_002639 [Bacidia gigantensis]|uniref:uncharacterized protein n=1 Tax=Bacidia gigantensis TaxID=2732470 RepID=UPI001D04FB55|nr:uncharacterized protein KY384_002639 [Bacidia gigantensis]KAG8532761.1 hypothetical protein KY384_002639 [Bacidia gigantensis]
MERPESYACKVFNEEDYPKITEDWTTATCLELVIEWLRGVILREWNGKAEIQKCSAVGGVLELMSSIYNYYGGRCVTCESFETPYVAETLDILLMPGTWMEFGGDNNLIHLLNYPFLFRPSTLVSFFRAINHAAMAKAYHEAKINAKLVESLGFSSRETGQGNLKSDDRVRRLTEENLFLTIRRDNILTDAFDQLWRRQQQELTRPLKVILGEDEGEEGEDHGGIQQEFLRLATAEFMDPKYGTFTTDSVTGMAWFQPSSLEPLYKFELFGLLTSLAIYNGLTLPFNLPIAFYMKLLNHPPSHLEDIEDGWPELAKGLKALKDWSDGDVEDTFCRAYQFSVDVFGTAQSVDMMPPSKSSPTTSRSSSPGIPMVTNANRHQYIQDYIYHLTTTSIEPQYEAFAKGFKAIINPKSLDLFTVTALQTLIQGVPKINTHDLEAVTKYEGGYFAEHYIIKHFWSIVHGWASGQGSEGPFSQNKEEAMEIGQARVQQLLEFVTASDRLPVGGEARVAFVVQKNGVGDERLPTSLTCFGRLLLPEYTSRWKTEKMLERAVENARGFGQP